jgi:hypothetical protein
MALLELHKHEGDVVELVSDAPATHIFSKQYVEREIAAGWMEFTGKPVSYKVTPDPLGEFAEASPLTIKVPGDQLVLHVVKDGEPCDITYRITHFPVPRSFRRDDENEADGIRIAPEYGVELVEG